MDQAGQLKALKEDLWKPGPQKQPWAGESTDPIDPRFVNKMNCNPILLRLAWHDAGTYDKSKTDFGDRGGANGSIRFSPEVTMGANNGLDKAVKYLEPFKAEGEGMKGLFLEIRSLKLKPTKADYPLVSYADIYQMAAAVSIEHAGGPKIDMKYGRKDTVLHRASFQKSLCPLHDMSRLTRMRQVQTRALVVNLEANAS